MAETLSGLPDEALRDRMQRLRGQEPDRIRCEAFALICEAIVRTLGLTPYEEQLLGGLAMADGAVAQMQTGEGKTMTAVFPACLQALSGRGAHIATVNPYLARRDCEWMRPVYAMLGFSVAVIEAGQTAEEKRKAYACDVTYGTHSEFGFDYLRDQLADSAEGQVQRAPAFMLVDEADSILLDEAVTPMILSGAGGELDEMLPIVDRFVTWLKPAVLQTLSDDDDEAYLRLDEQVDYIVLKKEKVAMLTSLGQKHAEQYFRTEDIGKKPNLLHLIYQAIQAHGTLKRDVDYIVRDGKLQIVDPYTGRVMEGRRYCNGLWQALQTKEHLPAVRESITVASISYQQYFRRYPILCGMTGTAEEGRKEFSKVYQMPVRSIPTHRKCIRRDLPDVCAADRKQQLALLTSEIRSAQRRGQPCLVVTRSVEDSETLCKSLEEAGVVCRLLNARQDAEEAEIIADAGRSGCVTVTTAMAGRGTDIRPDQEALAAGGLYVLGFGHQNTRRGDRQLRGRSGRQGDPGMSCFFVSPEDELFVRFLPQRKFSGKAAMRRAVRKAQDTCEGIACGQRESTLDLDEVIGRFRGDIYAWRNRILAGEIPKDLEKIPTALGKTIALMCIDEAWTQFLSESEDARQRCGVVSLTGRDYRREYVREVGVMFENMLESLHEQMRARASGVERGVWHVETL